MSLYHMSDRVFQVAYLYAKFHNVLAYMGHVVIIIRLWPTGHKIY